MPDGERFSGMTDAKALVAAARRTATVVNCILCVLGGLKFLRKIWIGLMLALRSAGWWGKELEVEGY